MAQRARKAARAPYKAVLVTIVFTKGSDQVAFQVTYPALLLPLPAVGEKVFATDKKVSPIVQIEGTVKSIYQGYYADTAFTRTINIEVQ